MKKIICYILLLFVTGTVIAQPAISSFTPVSGPVGTVVTINGTNFSSNPADNIVFFGAVRATVSIATANTLTVIAPAGSTYQPISVTTGGLTGFTDRPFAVTFNNNAGFSVRAFAPKSEINLPAAEIKKTGLADFDADGKTDIVVSQGSQNFISILKNNCSTASINFNPAITLSSAADCQDMAAPDIDGDGKLDIVVANSASNTITVYKNLSTPGNILFDNGLSFSTTPGPQYLCNGDFNKDGKVDIAVTSYNSNTISILRNSSSPSSISFEPAQNFVIGPNIFGEFPEQLIAEDINNDGKEEIISRIGNSKKITILKNSSPANGSIVFDPYYELNTTIFPESVTTADINNDYYKEIIITNSSSDSFTVIKNISNSGNISFDNPVSFYAGDGVGWLTVNDFDGDTKPDIAVSNFNGRTAAVIKNVSTGSILFSDNVAFQDNFEPQNIINGDINGDGLPDLILSHYSGSNLTIFRNRITEPAVFNFTPVHGGKNTVVTITGANFSAITGVSFGGKDATSFNLISPDTIIAVVDTGSSGFVKIVNAAGSDSLDGFNWHPLPVINSFYPPSGIAGSDITILGSDFTMYDTVRFGGILAATVGVLSSSEIIAKVANGASGNITVSGPGGTASIPGFSFIQGPLISSFSPSSAQSGQTVQITGNNFSAVSSVTFGGVPASSFAAISSTRIDAVVGTGSSGDIIVTTPLGADTIPGFIFLSPPAVTSFVPVQAAEGDTITVSGNNFSTATGLSFGNIPAAYFTIISPTQLKAVVGSGASGYIKVTNSGGSDSLAGFTFVYKPVIISFTPSAGDSGTVANINGSHFTGTTAVTFGGTPAVSFTVNTDNNISAVVGNGSTGAVGVTTAYGSHSLGTFTVFPYVDTADLSICPNSSTTITSNFSGASYQWQVNTGSGYTNISNNSNYSGTTTSILHLTTVPSSWYGYKYRCFINNSFYSRKTTLKFSNTWTGSAGSSWEDPANWSCGTVPDIYTDVIITSGTIIVSSNVAVRSLTISPGVSFTVISGGTVTVLGANPATGNLGGTPGSCTPFTINGAYNQEVPLNTSNSIQVQVNVTSAGPYAISTNVVNGVSFHKSGSFTSTGLQTITLTGSGIPSFAGTHNFIVSFGASACTAALSFAAAAPCYIPTTYASNWSYNATSTPNPVDSLYKESIAGFQVFNGQQYREFNEVNEFFLNHNSGYRKSGSNYYFYYNHFEDTHSLLFLQADGEIKQLDDAAAAGSTWFTDIKGWVNGGPQNTPVRVQGTILEKGVAVTLPTGLNFSNVIKVKLNFYDMTIPALPNFVYSEERWFAFGVGLIYYQSADPFGTGITTHLKRYQVN